MIINQILDDELQHSSSSASFPKIFWGIKVLPGKPVAVSLPNNSFNSLHISQATLEYSTSENRNNKMRSLVSINCDGENDILICSLRVKHCDMTTLKLDFRGPCEMVFSLRGPRGVHLVGYFYDCIPSPTNLIAPPIMDNGGGGSQQKQSVLSIKTHGHGIADFVGEAVKEKGGTSFSFKILVPGLAESLKHIPFSLEEQLEAQSAAIIKDAIEKNLGNQALTQEEKQGEKERKQKSKNKHLPIAVEMDEDNDQGEKRRKQKRANKHLPIVDEIEGEKNGSEKGRKQKGENKLLPIAAEIDGDNYEGEKKRKRKKANKHLPIVDEIDGENNGSKKGRKHKVENDHLTIAADIDGDTNEGSSVRRKLDYVLPVKEVQPVDRNEKESEEKRKKKRENKHLSTVGGAEGDNVEGSSKHDSPQTPLLESKVDIKMKRRQRRREKKKKKELGKLIDEDDHNRSLVDTSETTRTQTNNDKEESPGSARAVVCALPEFGKC